MTELSKAEQKRFAREEELVDLAIAIIADRLTHAGEAHQPLGLFKRHHL